MNNVVRKTWENEFMKYIYSFIEIQTLSEKSLSDEAASSSFQYDHRNAQ